MVPLIVIHVRRYTICIYIYMLHAWYIIYIHIYQNNFHSSVVVSVHRSGTCIATFISLYSSFKFRGDFNSLWEVRIWQNKGNNITVLFFLLIKFEFRIFLKLYNYIVLNLNQKILIGGFFVSHTLRRVTLRYKFITSISSTGALLERRGVKIF